MIEWEHLALYCQSDQDFFTSIGSLDDAASHLAASTRKPPLRWTRSMRDLWVRLTPDGGVLPDTGWKIHVSAAPEDADRVADIVWDYCVASGLAFKFLRSRQAIQLMNSKYADRTASGKTITIYPATVDELSAALDSLAPRLEGTKGPFILSDLRIGSGPLFVRYGAFRRLMCIGDGGEPVLARREPDGNLVPDVREALFSLPEGVAVPDVLRPHLEAFHAEDTVPDLPFEIEEALHYSNSGGVYRAKLAGSSDPVVIVEARPYAGLDRNGRDAVTRLGIQRQMLETLAGLPCVPRLIGSHTAWEHHFLIEEYVDGLTLFDEMVRRYPYAHNTFDPTSGAIEAYAAWAADVMRKLEVAVNQIAARGVRFGDLHPSNVIVRPDGEVVLVDFEYARDIKDTSVLDGGAPGFHAPPGMAGAAADRYQLECIRIWLHLPMNLRPEHTPAQLRRAINAVCQLFPLQPDFTRIPLSDKVNTLDVADELLSQDNNQWPAIRDSIVAGIMESADLSRPGALFPGGPPQFATGGFTLGYGAAGVLLALHRVGAEVPERFVEWIVAEVERSPYPRPGLYDGLHGVALVLDELGYAGPALSMFERARSIEDRVDAVGMLSGKAGFGLSLLHFANRIGDKDLLAQAAIIGEELAELIDTGEMETMLQIPLGGGVARGASGVALFLVRLYEQNGKKACLTYARETLQLDIDRGEFFDGNTFQLIDHGTRRRNVFYIDGGSTGVAIAAHEYLRHRQDERLDTIVAAVRRGCCAPFVRSPGLFRGRAGFMATLAHIGHPDDRQVITAHVPRLAMHAQPYNGHLAFPSTKLLRLSMDIATGSAGMLLALNSAFQGGEALPLLHPRVRNEITMEGR